MPYVEPSPGGIHGFSHSGPHLIIQFPPLINDPGLTDTCEQVDVSNTYRDTEHNKDCICEKLYMLEYIWGNKWMWRYGSVGVCGCVWMYRCICVSIHGYVHVCVCTI